MVEEDVTAVDTTKTDTTEEDTTEVDTIKTDATEEDTIEEDTTKTDQVEVEENVDNKEVSDTEEELPKEEQTDNTNKADTFDGLDALINYDGLKELYDEKDTDKPLYTKEENVENKIELSEGDTPKTQQSGENPGVIEPNYAEDEKNIGSYKETQLERGNGTAYSSIEPNTEPKDGFSSSTLEPSATSEDKTLWGVEIEFDKEDGQRTYTDFYFTNAGNMGTILDTGNISANEAGDKIIERGKDPNYKATSEIEITGSRYQRNLNLYAN